MTFRIPALIVLVALAACSDPTKTARFTLDPAPVTKQYPNRIGSAELREVSLPQYASDQEVPFQTVDGAVRSSPDNIWADDPRRAVTLALAQQISGLSGARVIAEPWPLTDLPQRRIEVRVEQFIATAQNTVRLAGNYYVTPLAGEGGDVMRRFDLSVPVTGEGPGAIAAAQGQAVTQLSARIAQLQ